MAIIMLRYLITLIIYSFLLLKILIAPIVTKNIATLYPIVVVYWFYFQYTIYDRAANRFLGSAPSCTAVTGMNG